MKKNNKGIALLLALIVLMVLFILSSAYMSAILSESGIARNQQNSEKAFFVAEAGIQRAIGLLVEDNSWRTGSLTENMSEGYYSLVVEDDPVYPERIRITSTGVVGRATRITRITLTITTGFDYAIFAGDISDPGVADINGSGASGTVRGDVHANGTANMGGINITTGTLTQGELGGPIENNIQIDMDFHIEAATIVYNGDTIINAERIQNQLIYVKGNATIDCSATKGVTFVQSSLIAEGNIIITGANGLKIDEYNYPGTGKVVALATKTGNITESGTTKIQNRDVKGLLFTELGTIDFQYLKTDAAVYAQNVRFRNKIDIDYRLKRFPTIGFIFGIQFYGWEEVFFLG
ncbi:MAG: hypothetical protein KJ893_01490 [Candidatus Omnitrophica bacterium]|nr:hypothetical protein [Candidatus Omnitrophota bacterium]MBU4478806.1 hypothetical protein [Candidatus Omnitrophota bacterium]MCG2702877.1 PilX N-terminal domain-containing pilus assembly protein [Candidatus Omnitrophota bacterium]